MQAIEIQVLYKFQPIDDLHNITFWNPNFIQFYSSLNQISDLFNNSTPFVKLEVARQDGMKLYRRWRRQAAMVCVRQISLCFAMETDTNHPQLAF